MHKLGKLLILAACLMLVGSAFAGKAKGPLANYTSKYGEIWIIDAEGRPEGSVIRTDRNPLDETIIENNFDDEAAGTLPEGWTQVDVDGGFCGQFNRNSTFQVFNYTTNARSQPNVIMNHYNDGAVPNNDWLILPQQTLGGEIILSFWAATQQATFPESFEVKVSTTGTTPANFTNLISAHNNIPAAWTEYTFDLSEYADTPFYVAIHHTSIDMFVLKIDDLLLTAGEAAPTGTIAGTVTDFETAAPIQGATIEIEGGASTTTDANGDYSFNVAAGTYTLNASAANYEDETVTGVVVVVDQTTTADIAMVPSSTVTTNYPSAATPVNIPDQSPTGANKNLTITDDFLIEDLDVTVNITHTWVSDLDLYLISPWGDTVQLAQDPTTFPPGANMTNCRFDDEAAVAFDYETLTAPFTGSWQPYEELGAFEGFTTQGIWTLRAVDNEQADVGSIGVFTIHVLHEASAIGPRGEGIPTGFAMHEAFPNPFNPSTRIDFDVPATTNGELKIYNSLGQEVATLVSGQLATGLHSVYFDASALTSGIYFAQLRAGSFVSTQKLVLMK